MEADECYYVQNEPRVRGKEDIDLERDPPPDLAIEIEVSRRVIERIPIYAAMGIPEVWRYDGESLRGCRLQGGHYVDTDRSEVFPMLSVVELAPFLARRDRTDETQLVKSFRSWVRAQFKISPP